MKLHFPLLNAVVQTVHTIFSEKKMADKAIQATLKSDKRFGSKDRAFIAENSYELVRWWRLYHYINGSKIEHCDNNTIWRLLGIKLTLEKVDLPNLPAFSKLDTSKIFKNRKEAYELRKVKESIPDWLDVLGEEELKDKWDELINALNYKAPLSIRVNTIKTNFQQLEKLLSAEDVYITEVRGAEDAAIIEKRVNVFSLKSFQDGFFEVQDLGSQMIAPFLEVKPGMRVIDACAGAGGKTLHLASLMENKGTIIAMDTEAWKLEELRKRAKRNGIHNIDTRVIEGKTIKRLKESADAVLLDVPCSGLGVLKRNPDAKWKLNLKFIEELKEIQYNILTKYSSMVKPGGKLVYATCSILPSENELQVNKFLKENPNFKLIREHNTDPITEECDGFYMALLVKEQS